MKLPLKLTLTDADGIVIDSWDSIDDMDVLCELADIDGVCECVKDAICEAADDELKQNDQSPQTPKEK